jgi:DNA-binding beta-propeller fold protein YncE
MQLVASDDAVYGLTNGPGDDGLDARLFRLDADAEAGEAPIEVPVERPHSLAIRGDLVWALQGDRSLQAYDLDLEPVGDPIDVGDEPDAGLGGAVTLGDDGYLWTANRGDGTISRVDPDSGSVQTFPVGGSPSDIDVADGRVWVVDTDEDGPDGEADTGRVLVFDPSTEAIAAEVPAGVRPLELVLTPEGAWVSRINDQVGLARIDITG